jgi:ribosomal protein S18 acetylase RimI-like enzyme
MTVIRTATRDDLPAIVALLARDELGQHREDAALPLRAEYARAFAAMGRQLDDRILLALDDGEVAGCLQLTLLPGLSRLGTLRAQIEGVRVSPSHQGRGVGSRLIEAAAAHATGAGCRLLQLTSDRRRPGAIAFYERLGFQASHVGLKMELR